ncbi:MAG TPA: hypothetical protein VJ124_00860, partial [Pyrinomonadaceae bacterium]|nr:hypothetical protein [Pyrinomonadaceae bacterium]
ARRQGSVCELGQQFNTTRLKNSTKSQPGSRTETNARGIPGAAPEQYRIPGANEPEPVHPACCN